MKKFMLMAMAVGAFSFASCSSDDDGGGSSSASCEELAQNYSDAALAYAEDPTEANCSAFDDAADDLLDSDCTGSDAVVFCPN